MKISDLMEQLEKIEEEHGDILVMTMLPLVSVASEHADAGPLEVCDVTCQDPKTTGNEPYMLIIH